MHRNKSFFCGILITLTVFISGCASIQTSLAGWFGKRVNINTLLDEMVSMDHLTHMPAPTFTTAQSSSYDRRSLEPDNYQTWFANADYGQYAQIEDHGDHTEYVMLDAAGPGTVTRIWSANPMGTLRVYIDGAMEPVIEADMKQLLSGQVPPFIAPLGHEVSRGFNLYFPIPYALSCKITTDGDERREMYYQVNTRTWPEGTHVASLSEKQLMKASSKIHEVAAVLASPSATLDTAVRAKGSQSLKFNVKPNTGRVSQAFSTEKKGPFQKNKAYQVSRIIVKTHGITPDDLRKTLLEIDFDGQTHISAPLGDFFGSGLGFNPYDSLPLSVHEDGTLVCRWPMPFRQSMNVRIESAQTSLPRMEVSMTLDPIKWTDNTMYFNAFWRADYDLAEAVTRDFKYVDLEGKGLYVGNSLNVGNPVKAWWGEGDEKIWVDGEDFPSHFGTGSEDYYGYAWCHNETFINAYHNQPRCDGPKNYGHTAVNRWHIFDPIPFRKSLTFNLEQYVNSGLPLKYDVINYWYATADTTHSMPMVTLEDLRVPTLPELPVLLVPGIIEGEKMKTTRVSNGMVQKQDMSGYEDDKMFWSGSAQMWWMEGKPGDELELEFHAPASGDFRVTGYFTKAGDYGITQISINGKPGENPIDLYAPRISKTGPLDLGVYPIHAGKNILKATIVGINPEANPKRYMFGMDGIVLGAQ